MNKQILDASKYSLGRLASQSAVFLIGKHKVNFQHHLISGDKVEIINAQKVKITGKKLEQKIYYHHTNYPGGLRETPMRKINKKELIRRAVLKMLPKNKLRRERMKNLIIKD